MSLVRTSSLCTAGSVSEGGRAGDTSLDRLFTGEGVTISLSVLVAYEPELVELVCVSSNGRG